MRNSGSKHRFASLRRVAKRGLDLFCCAMAFPVFGPVCLYIAWRIRREDGGDVFFFQKRIGQGGKPFLCAKFRTMNQGRGARIGEWLRSTGLDELAQIINIFRGEMSAVGPRPLTQEDIETMGWRLNDVRFQQLPGMTGLTQIIFPTLSRRSLACDRIAALRQSFLGDVGIIFLSLLINFIGKTRFRKMRLQLIAFCRKVKNSNENKVHPSSADRG